MIVVDFALAGGGGIGLVRYTGGGRRVSLTAPDGERCESRMSRWWWDVAWVTEVEPFYVPVGTGGKAPSTTVLSSFPAARCCQLRILSWCLMPATVSPNPTPLTPPCTCSPV